MTKSINPTSNLSIEREFPEVEFLWSQTRYGSWLIESTDISTKEPVGSVGFRILEDGAVEVGELPHRMYINESQRGRGGAIQLMRETILASQIIWCQVLKKKGHPRCIIGTQGDGSIDSCKRFWIDCLGVPEKFLCVRYENFQMDPDSRFESKNRLDEPRVVYRVSGDIYNYFSQNGENEVQLEVVPF